MTTSETDRSLKDNCTLCEFKGNMKECEKAHCFVHNSWYARTLKKAVLRNEEALDDVAKMAREMLEELNGTPE